MLEEILHDDVSEQIDSFCSSSQELGNQSQLHFSLLWQPLAVS
jgi:hypothetical protein